MANTATLAVKIVSDSSAARADIGKSSDAVGKWGDRATKVGRFAGRALAVGIGAAAAAAVKFTQAAADDAASAQKLADSLKQTAGATDEQVAATEKWIEAQGKALGVADDELRPALSRLATVTGSVSKAQRLAALAMDIAARTGKPLKTVTEGLAKAQTGSITGLAKFGVQVKNNKGETKALDVVMRNLSKTYAGAAAKSADTAAGRQKRLSVAMGELQEKIGAKLLPVMEKLIDVGFKVVDWIDQNQKKAGILVGAIGGLLAVVYAITTAYKVWMAVSKAAAILQGLFFIKTVAATGAVTAQAGATTAATAAQTGLNTAMRLNPIGLIITAVVLLVAGFVLLYKKSDTFRALVQKVGEVGRTAITWVVDAVKKLVGWFSTVLKWVGDKIPGGWRTMQVLVVGYIKLITAPWRILFGLIMDVAGWLRDRVPAAFQTVKDKAVAVKDAILAPFKGLADFIGNLIGKVRELIRLAGTVKGFSKGSGAVALGDIDFSGSNPRTSERTTSERTVERITVQVDGSLIGTTDERVGDELLNAINRGRRVRGLAPL